jgi:hypothetical protein
MGGYRLATQRNYNHAWGVWGRFLDETLQEISTLITVEATTANFLLFLEWLTTQPALSTGAFLLYRSAVSSLFRMVYPKGSFGDLYGAQLIARKMRIDKPRQVKRRDVFSLDLLLNFIVEWTITGFSATENCALR